MGNIGQTTKSTAVRISRRRFLEGVAAASALTAFGPTLSAGAIHAQGGDVIKKGGVYPAGPLFPLGWYDIGTDAPEDPPESQDPVKAMLQERESGFTIAHRYGEPSPDPYGGPLTSLRYLQQADEGRVGVLTNIATNIRIQGNDNRHPVDEATMAGFIAERAESDRPVWWNLTEELRYWRVPELEILTNYSSWTRQYDPLQRPVHMYEPGHRQRNGLAETVPYLDVIGVGAYTNWYRQPHPWLRWRVEELIHGINLAGATIGSDYLNGEKTPVAALELFWGDDRPVPTPAGAYHDFWQALVSGARGIMIYSYYRRLTHPSLPDVLDAYNTAAQQLTGSVHLDDVILYGTELGGVTAEVTDGPPMTPEFTPIDVDEPISYPSIDLLAKRWRGRTYVIAVNSSPDPVTGRLAGLSSLPRSLAILPFERQHLTVVDGDVSLEFEPLGVHVLMIPGGA